MDAHEPYDPDPERLSRFRNGDCSVDIEWHLRCLGDSYSDAEIECINDQYDACLNYLDHHIGELFNALGQQGVLDDTIVILTADHGKCLGEHSYLGVGTYLYDELVHVPLIVSGPDHPRSTVSEEVSQIDLRKKILRLVGLDVDEPVHSGTYSETVGPNQDVEFNTSDVPSEGLRRVDYNGNSLIRDIDSGSLVQEDGYSDTVHQQLIEAEESYKDHISQREMGEDPEIDVSVRDHFEDLGYL